MPQPQAQPKTQAQTHQPRYNKYQREYYHGKKLPPVPDSPEAQAVKRLLYNNFWPFSAFVMKNPNPPKKPLTPEEKQERSRNIGMTLLTIVCLPFALLLGGGRPQRSDHRSTEEKDFERYGVHGQHYWEPYLDPHGNAK